MVESVGGPERRWFTLRRMSAVRVRLSPTRELSRYKAILAPNFSDSAVRSMIYHSWTLIRSIHLAAP
ncbi:hypothetical protein L1987_87781 [Smallanthus sonchifolius]|nr:hypothetical protein L1987_87781 [Smallanthus sonchifolius]